MGAGGEARVAAAKLDELRKKGEAERQRQSADWSVKSASAKKRSARSSGLPGTGDGGGAADGDDDGLEERTLRVKWKTKKESHSDYTLDVLFARFGAVQSVSIEEGRGDRALVVFATAASADAAMAAYGDRESSETMRTSYVGKRRPKRSAFAPRRQTMSPKTPTSAAWGGAATGGGDAEGESLSSFRDHESVVMMNLRKEGERQALMRKMAEEEGLPVDGGGKNAAAAAAAPAAGGAAVGAGAEESEAAVAAAAAASTATGRTGGVEGGRESGGSPGSSSGSSNNPSKAADANNASEKGEGKAAAGATAAEATTPAARSGWATPSRSAGAGGGAAGEAKPVFPIPSPMTSRVMPAPSDIKSRRKSDALLPAMMGGGGSGAVFGRGAPTPPAVSAFGIGSKSMPTTPVSGRGAAGQAIDESDILARMMAMKR